MDNIDTMVEVADRAMSLTVENPSMLLGECVDQAAEEHGVVLTKALRKRMSDSVLDFTVRRLAKQHGVSTEED